MEAMAICRILAVLCKQIRPPRFSRFDLLVLGQGHSLWLGHHFSHNIHSLAYY